MMVDLLPQPGPLVTAQAPTPKLSAQDIQQPYSELADTLKKFGEGSESFAENAATQAGYKAVTRDADGNVQITKMPIIGPASHNYEAAMKVAALTDGESAAKNTEIKLRREYPTDPEGYLTAANAARDKTVADYASKGAPEVGLALGRSMDNTIAQSYRGLWAEKQKTDLASAGKSIDSGIQDATDNLTALARGGDTSSDAFQQSLDKVKTLLDQKVKNPLFAYPKEQADFDLQHLQGQLRGQAFLNQIDQAYQSAPTKADGARTALERAKDILTNPDVKISQQERQQFFSRAVGEIHQNEAIRKQDLNEARAAVTSLKMVQAYGGTIYPSDIEGAANALRASGGVGDVARLYAWSSRADLHDDFGRQPLSQQNSDIQTLSGGGPITKSYVNTTFRIESGGNPNAVTGSNRGLGQFGPEEERRFGLNDANRTNPDAQARALQLEANQNRPKLTAALGRPPTEAELYIAHQQGAAGGPALLANPDKPAWEAIRQFYGSDAVAKKAITGNIPSDNPLKGVPVEQISAGQFTDMWKAKYAHFAGQPVDTAQSGQPIQLASNAPGVAGLSAPASAMWQQANRIHVADQTASQEWKRVYQDWNNEGIRPPDDTVLQIANAARAAKDWPLLDQIGVDIDGKETGGGLLGRMRGVEAMGGQPLPQQQAQIGQMQSEGAAGNLQPGMQAMLKDLQRKNAAITAGLEKNPITTAVSNLPQLQGKQPAPLDYSDPAMLAAGLKFRGQIAQIAANTWQSGPVAALDQADLNQMKSVLQGPDVATKATVLSALNTLPEDVRNATLSKLAKEGGPDMAVSAAAATLLPSDPNVAQSILRGQMALKTDKAFWPKGQGEEQAVTEAMNKSLPPNVFGLAARTDPQGPYATTQGMVKARYADLSAQASDVSGTLNKDRLTQAVNDVTGGVLDHNGAPLIAPQRGMSQADFDRTLNGVNEADLANVTTLNGAPVTPDYLRANAQLESVGQGRYLVRLGKDTGRPIYAYQGANTEAPQKFVLDLRGRQPGPPPRFGANDAPEALP